MQFTTSFTINKQNLKSLRHLLTANATMEQDDVVVLHVVRALDDEVRHRMEHLHGITAARIDSLVGEGFKSDFTQQEYQTHFATALTIMNDHHCFDHMAFISE